MCKVHEKTSENRFTHILVPFAPEVPFQTKSTNSLQHPVFMTVKVLENTPAALSLGKLCDENGYSYEWINGQKPHFI